MFCQNCGEQLENGIKFCTRCGKLIDIDNLQINQKELPSDTDILLELKPVFNLKYCIVKNLPIFICIILFPLIVFLTTIIFDSETTWLTIISALMLILGIVGFIMGIFLEKKQMKNINYKFYNKKLEYSDSFLNKAEKVVKYKNIREVVFRRTILERMFGFGSIKFYTSADAGVDNGVIISCLENSEEVYKKVKTLIDIGTI